MNKHNRLHSHFNLFLFSGEDFEPNTHFAHIHIYKLQASLAAKKKKKISNKKIQPVGSSFGHFTDHTTKRETRDKRGMVGNRPQASFH